MTMSKISYAPRAEFKVITPEMAQVFLSRSKRPNVPVKESKIREYAAVMSIDKWDKYNSQAISIDVNGDIVNGHQRLMACVRCGRAFETLFITGVPPETFKTEDSGRSRDASHFFAALGEKNYKELASVARVMYLWERGQWQWSASVNSPNVLVTNDDLRDEVDRRNGIRKAAAYVKEKRRTMAGRYPSGLVGGLYVLTAGSEHHDDWWKQLVDRLADDPLSPAYQLNKRIDNAKLKQTRITPYTLLALMTKAWNMFAEGKENWIRLQYNVAGESVPPPTTRLKPMLLAPAADTTKNEVVLSEPGTAAAAGKAKPSPSFNRAAAAVDKKSKRTPKLRGGLN